MHYTASSFSERGLPVDPPSTAGSPPQGANHPLQAFQAFQ